ncbi:SdrD B-like domain-containing protein, partial [Streptomyces sp. NPDC093982]|uniref:SdrD B-like domain-containing protein n=1 Tax=Streptomyces sp. NPDC093982 TaxID=3155077 RepID=UPI00342A893B
GMAKPRTSLLDTRDLSSNVEFIDLSAGKNVEITTSFWSPEDYCQQNATLVAACMVPTIPVPAPDTNKTLTSFPFNARGEFNQLTTLATNTDTGTLLGVSYNRVTKQLFSSAYAKRGTKYGPGGPGAIYQTDPATGTTHLFTTVPNPGTTAHNPGVALDEAFARVVNKESLGDLKVSPDGKDLYVVNLQDRRLYRYDAMQSTAAAQKASYAIPDPGCSANSDWRPSGLGVHEDKVYIGGVCSAESTQNKADLRAVVYEFNPTTGQITNTVMDQPLNFSRGGNVSTATACANYDWYPWLETRPLTQDGMVCSDPNIIYPQPLLTDIDFETNGDMLVAFSDRFNDVAGWELVPTSPAWPATTTVSGGDINRACRGGNHMFVLDGNGGCTNNATPANSGGYQDPDAKEFYPGDHSGAHSEAAEGALAISKVETTLPFTQLDTVSAYSEGVGWVDRTTGTRTAFVDGNTLTTLFGKARGIGGLEVLCDEAPLQLGNRVWFDTDQDGIQDPGEKPVVGATVNLYDADGNKIGTATTNARGEYYFDSTVVKNVRPEDLQYGRTYTVKMDNPDDYEDGGVLDGWASTKPGAGDNDEIDSSGEPNGDPFPSVTVTPMGAGQNDHSLDFGFIKPSVDLSVIKVGPATVEPGGEVKYDIVITNNGPNDSTGYTVTDPLPDELTNVTTSSAGCSINAHILTCTGGPLKKGQSHTITVSGTAPMPPHPGITIDNCVEVDGKEPDPDPTNDKDCEPTYVPPIPVIDPTIGGTAAALLALGGTLYLRRRNTNGETL